MLDFKGVSKGFGVGDSRVEILKGIDLHVPEGEFLAILGFSGTGKTTLTLCFSTSRFFASWGYPLPPFFSILVSPGSDFYDFSYLFIMF